MPSVSDSILLESRSNINVSDRGPLASVHFFHELVKPASAAIRILDWTVAGVVTLVTAPFVPLLALAIRLAGHPTVFQTHERIGFRGLPIRVRTFQTEGAIPRTAISRFLIRTGLDRIPLFWSVFSGAVGVVGITLRSEAVATRLNNRMDWFYKLYAAKPGIITLASVNGLGTARDLSDQVRQAEYDLRYLLQPSATAHMRILLRRILPARASSPVMPAPRETTVRDGYQRAG